MAFEFKKKLQNLRNRFPTIGRFAEIPAGWIDRMDLEEKSSFINEAWYFIRKRVIFLLFFLYSLQLMWRRLLFWQL